MVLYKTRIIKLCKIEMGNKEKTPELYAAKRALAAYFKNHNLDPTDQMLMKDPVHGKNITDLVNKLNKERDKVMANYPAADRSNNLKLLKMAKKEKTKKVHEVKEEASEKKTTGRGRTSTKYDYPKVKDEKTGKMREMTSDEKKKFRVEARKQASGNTETAKVKKAKKVEAPVEEKKAKKVEKKKDKDKKKKKAKKDED